MPSYCRLRQDVLPVASDSSNATDLLKGRIHRLRCQTRTIILLLALTEALKHGPLELVYAGRQGFAAPSENDYGITYTTAYILSYLYICAFMIVYIPLFSWIPRLFPSSPKSNPTDPNTPTTPTKMETLARWIQAFNMLWLPLCTGISGLIYTAVLLEALVYVDERRISWFQFPKNTKQIWTSRATMILCIAMSVGLGYGAFSVLEMMELARVKTSEYVAIVVPVQINIGMMISISVQRRMEKRGVTKAVRDVEERGSMVDVAVDEKGALIPSQ